MDAMIGVDAKEQNSAEKKAKKKKKKDRETADEKGKLQKSKKSDEDSDAPAASKRVVNHRCLPRDTDMADGTNDKLGAVREMSDTSD
ncbi:unnamed protein product [Vitrella brassicaformis CCMP3155]|uniref:Uncharacterized protein n=1 Tax=Vitrella brassicaformis (strain CCMP3155) TaxID=1169540 RepID=A0A0G4E9D9_VITBC|nr:unnamed protein product [Vitrella brassicaformis CCMP3155]|eukprot:CEL92481.1 unnamed protein product [Vitrella brassicaformis CCMP3155]